MTKAAARRLVFRLLTLAILATSGFLVLEGVARWQEGRIRESDQLDPGLIRLDPRLGWRLSPNWQGGHRHHDFDVTYRINTQGYRHDPAQPSNRRGKLIAVVGDSFTFGLGVNDSETFTSLLNASGTNTWVNLAIPGYSTDQELLLLEEELPRLRPDEVWLAVYVGNDLLDNQFSRPIQFGGPKPRFTLGKNGLEFHPPGDSDNSGGAGSLDLATVVLGRGAGGAGIWDRLANRSVILRRLRAKAIDRQDYAAGFEARFELAVRLFTAMLERTQQLCVRSGASLRVLVLSGRSAVEEPGSLSAQYQAYFARQVFEACRKLELPAMDLGLEVERQFKAHGTRYFHVNDGHLNPLGHAAVQRGISPPAAPTDQR